MMIEQLTPANAEVTSERHDAWFRAVADASPALICISGADQRCTWCNRSRLEFTGRSLDQEINDGWTESIHPDDLDRCVKAYECAFEARAPLEIEYRLRSRNGTYRWVLDQAGPILAPDGEFAGYFSSCVDIHDRKNSIEEARTAAEHFRTLADASPQWIATARADGYVDWFNRRWFEYSGCTAEELRGEGWAHRTLHPSEVQSTLSKWRDAVAKGEPMEVEHRFRAGNGAYRWHVTRVVPLRDAQGKLLLWMGVSTDVDAIKQAHEAARQASQAKDEFLAALSHELRTPLTPVLLLAAELQADPNFPQQFRDAISTIRHNAELEARLIDDLLDLTRIAHGKLHIRRETADLHSLLAYTEKVIRNTAREKGVSLTFKMKATASHVRADAGRLQQVAWNLLNNAVKFTKTGGSIEVRTANPDPGSVRLEIQDTGIGIPAEHQSQIFDAFNRGEFTGHHRFGGLGLGLAISRAIIHLHGGNLTVESAGSGRGSTFIVTLDAVSPPALFGEDTPHDAPTDAKGLRILLVEDHPPTLRVLEKLLRRDGHIVTVASTMDTAVNAGLVGDFDVLVSDLGLPDGTGFEVMEQLRQSKHIKGIALSGYGMDVDLERSERAGFSRHLIKPIDFALLRQALAEVQDRK